MFIYPNGRTSLTDLVNILKKKLSGLLCSLLNGCSFRYNPRTLPGVKAVRKLKMSRGGREGNNALVKVSENEQNIIVSEETVMQYVYMYSYLYCSYPIFIFTQTNLNYSLESGPIPSSSRDIRIGIQ